MKRYKRSLSCRELNETLACSEFTPQERSLLYICIRPPSLPVLLPVRTKCLLALGHAIARDGENKRGTGLFSWLSMKSS